VYPIFHAEVKGRASPTGAALAGLSFFLLEPEGWARVLDPVKIISKEVSSDKEIHLLVALLEVPGRDENDQRLLDIMVLIRETPYTKHKVAIILSYSKV